MNSPIILLVLWFVINLIAKSLKDKQKIEEARRKKASQIEQNQRSFKTGDVNKETLQRDVRKAISTIREEIDKQRNLNTNTSKTQRQDTSKKQIPKREMPRIEVTNSLAVESIEPQIEKINPTFGSREDIIKGIIFSEILSEPKSIQRLKRSI